MKRSPLARRTPLKPTAGLRRTLLRSRPKRPAPSEQRDAWKSPVAGYCQCGCQKFALRLERHHVVERSFLVREGLARYEWDPRNQMLLHPRCHERHTNAFRRLPLESVPEMALAFAYDVLGEDRAVVYLARAYRADVSRRLV